MRENSETVQFIMRSLHTHAWASETEQKMIIHDPLSKYNPLYLRRFYCLVQLCDTAYATMPNVAVISALREKKLPALLD